MKEHRLSTQLLTGKERMRAGREKLKLQVLVSQDRKFRCLKVWDVILSFKNKFGLTKCIWPPATNVETPGKVKAVGSKLREESILVYLKQYSILQKSWDCPNVYGPLKLMSKLMERWKRLAASWERMVHEELVELRGVFWPAFSSIKDGQDV